MYFSWEENGGNSTKLLELHSLSEFPFLSLWITLSCVHVQHACYCILYFLARYSNLYVIYSYFPPWLLLNSSFAVCFMLTFSIVKIIEIKFQPVFYSTFSTLYLVYFQKTLFEFAHFIYAPIETQPGNILISEILNSTAKREDFKIYSCSMTKYKKWIN